jgi:hypothetical protein
LDAGMGDLMEAMQALRDELAGFDGEVTLGIDAHRGEDGRWSWRLASGPASHSLRWALGHGVAQRKDAASPVLGAAAGGDWSEAAIADALGQLDAVFGPPGFDSGARATVFREVAADVGEEGLARVLELLQRGQASEEPDLERARHGLARLLERGPSGSREGARILGRLVGRHGLARILDWVSSRWRFGT